MIRFLYKMGQFESQNDRIQVWIHIFARKWQISVGQSVDLDRIRPQIDLEIDNKNRFPVWAKLRQNVRFSDNLT